MVRLGQFEVFGALLAAFEEESIALGITSNIPSLILLLFLIEFTPKTKF